MSSRENPNVSCVRSLVPNEKNCASCGDLVGRHRAARHLDHRADQVLDLDPLLLHDVGGDAIDDGFLIAQLLHEPDQRDHDLGDDLEAFLGELTRRLDDRARLHLGDLRIGDPSRTPRCPSIGLNSCSCSTRRSSVCFSWSSLPLSPFTSSLAISTISSSRFGRNSCSGGSIVRMVTGVPCIALNTP